jgi:hypothetical protein
MTQIQTNLLFRRLRISTRQTGLDITIQLASGRGNTPSNSLKRQKTCNPPNCRLFSYSGTSFRGLQLPVTVLPNPVTLPKIARVPQYLSYSIWIDPSPIIYLIHHSFAPCAQLNPSLTQSFGRPALVGWNLRSV